MKKQQELIAYISTLNQEQARKISVHLPLIKLLVKMTDNELSYTEKLLTKLFGKGTEE